MKRALLLLAMAACDNGLDQRLAILREPRVLAIVADPAEGKPNASITYTAIAGSPDGPLAPAPHWRYCLAPKPPTEDNAVSQDCVEGNEFVELGTSASVTAAIPSDACINFGPDTPGTGFRPRDADPTGGYYQPVRADVDDIVAFGLARVTCKLPSAPADLARRYDMEYRANANPTLDPVTLDRVRADSDVTLTATWPAAVVETYLYYDPLAQQLVDRREAMRVSWFATGGSLAVDATAVGEDDDATSVSTTWHTPTAGPATVWLVLRDSRGGIATQTIAVTVE